MSDKKGQRTMTLADFIKVFDFEYFNLEIAYFGKHDSYNYSSRAAIERDYYTAIYTVLSISPVDETTIQVIIWQ